MISSGNEINLDSRRLHQFPGDDQHNRVIRCLKAQCGHAGHSWVAAAKRLGGRQPIIAIKTEVAGNRRQSAAPNRAVAGRLRRLRGHVRAATASYDVQDAGNEMVEREMTLAFQRGRLSAWSAGSAEVTHIGRNRRLFLYD